jgi:DNA-binding GntR family transcriptional regulator
MSSQTSAKRLPRQSTKAPATGKALVKTTLLVQTYEAIKERIFDQTLKPGARLNIDALSRELNVSSTPIREALARLEAERLVVLELYSGYSVAPQPTLDYLRNLLDYRVVVEGHCARIGAARKHQATIARMKQLVEKMTAIPRLGTKYREYRRFVAYDGDFHQLIVDSADNKVFSETYRSLNAIILQSRLYLNREGGSTTSSEVVDEHRAILEAFQNGDGEQAEAAVRMHLEGGRRRLLSQDNLSAA